MPQTMAGLGDLFSKEKKLLFLPVPDLLLPASEPLGT